MGRGSGPLSARRVEESDLELSVITSQNSHYGGSDRSMGQIRGNISLQKIFHNKTLIKLSGDEWKEVRSMFSPCFTSGRMKMMTKFMKVDH